MPELRLVNRGTGCAAPFMGLTLLLGSHSLIRAFTSKKSTGQDVGFAVPPLLVPRKPVQDLLECVQSSIHRSPQANST
jgi:hypothetical protein